MRTDVRSLDESVRAVEVAVVELRSDVRAITERTERLERLQETGAASDAQPLERPNPGVSQYGRGPRIAVQPILAGPFRPDRADRGVSTASKRLSGPVRDSRPPLA